MINDWYEKNVKAVSAAGLIDSIYVSSWCLVMDIWWKKGFADVRADDVQPKAAAPYLFQGIGATGDTIGVSIAPSVLPDRVMGQGAFLLR